MPKDYLQEGKYGIYNTLNILQGCLSEIQLMYTLQGKYLEKVPRYYEKFANITAESQRSHEFNENSNLNRILGKNKSGSYSNGKFWPTDEVKSYIKELKKDADETIRKIEDDKKQNRENHLIPYLGLFRFIRNSLDTEKGSYSEMMMDSPIMFDLKCMLANTMKTDPALEGCDSKNVGEVLHDWQVKMSDPKGFKGPGPFSYIMNYYNDIADIQELELEKQRIRDDYSPQKEKDYLKRLSAVYTKFTENMDKFTEFAKQAVKKETGHSPYDSLLQNTLDMFTGTVPSSTLGDGYNVRNIRVAQGWIRGMNRAAQNGWGMNELEIPGSIDAILAALEGDLDQYMIDKAPKARKEIKNAVIQNYNKQIEAVKKLKAAVWNTKVTTKEEKIQIANEVRILLDVIAASGIPGVDSYYKRVSSYIDSFLDENITEFSKGRKFVKVPEDLMTDSFKKNQEKAFILDEAKNIKNSVIKMNNPALYNEVFEENKAKRKGDHDRFYDHVEAQRKIDNSPVPNKMQGLGRGITGITVERMVGEEEAEKAGEKISGWINRIHDWYEGYICQLPAEERVFTPVYNLFNTVLHTKKGSFLDACLNNQILARAKNHFNTTPNIFREKGNPDVQHFYEHADVKKHLEEQGTLLSVVGYFTGINDVIKAEYTRQEHLKKGWDTEAEKEYFSQLAFAYGEIIKAYDELSWFPDEVQSEMNHGMVDCLGAITDQYGEQERGITAEIDAMKWEMQGMKNGWHAEHIAIMRNLGLIEGKINQKIKVTESQIWKLKASAKRYEESHDEPERLDAENQVAQNEQLLKALKAFKKNELSAFKKTIWDKKISNPSDVLDVLNLYDEFRRGNEGNNVISPILNELHKDISYTLDDCNNKALSDLVAIRAGKTKWREPVKLGDTLSDVEENRDLILDVSIRDKETLSGQQMVEFACQHVLVGMTAIASKNQKSTKYSTYLSQAVRKYASEFVEEILKANNATEMDGKLFAEYLKNGHHENYYRQIENNVSAEYRKSRLTYFLEGNFSRNGKGKPVNINKKFDSAIKDVTTADVMAPMTYLEDTKYGKFRNGLAWVKNEKEQIDKILKNKLNKKEDVCIDKDRYDALIKKVDKLIEDAKELINEIQEKGSDKQTKIDFVMNDALENGWEALAAMKRGLENFKNKGPSGKQLHQMKSYGVDAGALKDYMKLHEDKYKELQAQAKSKVEKLMEAEKSKCYKAMNPYEIENIMDSAMKMIYLDALNSAYSKDGVSFSKGEKLTAELLKSLDAFEKAEGNNSEGYLEFKNTAFGNSNYKNAFEAVLREKIKFGEVKPADICDCRDEAMRKAQKDILKTIKENKNDKNAVARADEDMEKLDQLAKKIGSPVPSKVVIREQRRLSVQKVVQKVEEKIMNRSKSIS